MRILAIDPGEKHFGVAISDPGGIIARPLLTFRHTARGQDAARIASHGSARWRTARNV